MDNKTSPAFIATLVAAIALAIGLAVTTIMYVFSRKRLAEAQAALSLKGEEIEQLKEKRKLEANAEAQNKIDQQVVQLEDQVNTLRDSIFIETDKAEDFEEAIKKMKSWAELKISSSRQ